MRTEEQVVALFGEANRIPDPQDLDSAALAGYLVAIEQRRTGMTQLSDQEAIKEAPTRRRGWTYALAGAIAIAAMVVIGVVMAGGGETEVPTATQPPTPPEMVETTVAQSQSSEQAPLLTAENIVGEWSTNAGDGGNDLSIKSDGTLQHGDPEGPGRGLFASGTWTLEDDVLTFTSDGTASHCEAGDVATMKLSFTSDGRLNIGSPDDPCWDDMVAAIGPRFSYTWKRN